VAQRYLDETDALAPLVKYSGAVLIGKTRFRVKADDTALTHHRWIKAEFLINFRRSHRDNALVAGKQLMYGEITDIFSIIMGEQPWVFVRANWFALTACSVDPKTHNVVVNRALKWSPTSESLMLAQDITAQVLLAHKPKDRPFDPRRGVFLDRTPLYPPLTPGGLPRLVMPIV